MDTTNRYLRILALALVALLVVPVAAFAAPAPVALYDVRTALSSDGSRAMLVGVELRPTSTLPAEVRLNVPKGVKVSWAGEILGGDPSKDPPAEYKTEPGRDFDTLVFTLKQAKRGQVEFSLPAPQAGSSGTRMGITWQVPVAADSVQLAVQVPKGAQISSSTAGASATTASDGSVFYYKEFPAVKAGQRLDLAVVYAGGTLPAPSTQQQAPQQQAPAQAQQGGTAPATSSGAASPVVIVLALGVILAGTFYLLDRVKQAPSTTRSH